MVSIRASQTEMNGYVLVMVLVFIAIISALTLHELQALSQEQRVLLDEAQYRGLANKGKRILAEISRLDLAKETCARRYECRITEPGVQGYYIIERQISDKCSILGNKQPVIADYYRVTLMIESILNIAIQSGVLQTQPDASTCIEGRHLVVPGVKWSQFL